VNNIVQSELFLFVPGIVPGSVAEGTSENAMIPAEEKDVHSIRARCASVFAKASTGQAVQSRTAGSRVPGFAVAVAYL
jgi:hypothetical protein